MHYITTKEHHILKSFLNYPRSSSYYLFVTSLFVCDLRNLKNSRDHLPKEVRFLTYRRRQISRNVDADERFPCSKSSLRAFAVAKYDTCAIRRPFMSEKNYHGRDLKSDTNLVTFLR